MIAGTNLAHVGSRHPRAEHAGIGFPPTRTTPSLVSQIAAVRSLMASQARPDLVGRTVRKEFGEYGWFNGTIQSFDVYPEHDLCYYSIQYEDGDAEEMTLEEVQQHLVRAKKRSISEAKSEAERFAKRVPATTTSNDDADESLRLTRRRRSDKSWPVQSRRVGTVPAVDEDTMSEDSTSEEEDDDEDFAPRRAAKSHSILESSSDEESLDVDDDESLEEIPKPRNRRRSVPRARSLPCKSSEVVDDDSTEDEASFDDKENLEESPKEKSRRSKKPAQSSAKPPAVKKDDEEDESSGKMYMAFKPLNAPTFPKLSLKEIEEKHAFLDPCGMEATDDIIDRLVGDQVDKIGALLLRALKHDESIGSMVQQLTLGTACSGTDAPALAMTLVKEQLELRGLGNVFGYSHEFSCEVDPFKQAYLARNFDSVLYPDIARLVDLDNPDYVPRDVYGQAQELPPCNMFVAGTSCKNFSMLRNKYRIDIEDKGCSGETFFAAVDVLFQLKPAFCIFENVQSAPWEKMKEYITGRVRLANCSDSKAVKGYDKKRAKTMQLTFAMDGDSIVVEQVPAVYGVRCGAVVKGFLKGDSDVLREVSWTKKQSSFTLAELVQANGISQAKDTLVFETGVTYCAQTVKVDSKDFGVPQTRNRTYLFVWRPDDDNISDDLGEYWKAIVEHLKSPTRHSLDAFLLDDDHEIVRVFREALRGPPGRQTKRSFFLEPDFWSSVNKNLPHNKWTRKKLGLEDTARWLMNWQGHGQKQIPPSFWIEYFDCCEQRMTDMTDILYAAGIRDAEVHDPLFCNYFWNLSQNASKEHHRTAWPAVASCITPGGDVLVPHRGRPVLGCEKLMLQAIPYFRLLLGNETEVQLSDLAGNAMTLTVVGATMLAALTCKQLRRDTLEKAGDTGRSDLSRIRDQILRDESHLEHDLKYARLLNQSPPEGEDVKPMSTESSKLFQSLAELASDAVESSIHCTCETSGCNSSTCEFLECSVCRVSCCRTCLSAVSGYNLTSHVTNEVTLPRTSLSPAEFINKLRTLLPPTLIIEDAGWECVKLIEDDMHRVGALTGSTFSLHSIVRKRRKWLVAYHTRDNDGVGETTGELCLSIGELRTESRLENEKVGIGVKAEFRSFIPALAHPRVYGFLEPCIKYEQTACGDSEGAWFGNHCRIEVSVQLSGDGTTDSLRAEVGLLDSVEKELAATASSKKEYAKAKALGEGHRWKYNSAWKTWPETIKIGCGGSDRLEASIGGSYHRSTCRQTTNQSALWIRSGDTTRYIIIKPNVHRTGPDECVLSESIDYNDSSSILAYFPRGWQPEDAFSTGETEVTLQLSNWQPLDHFQVSVPLSTVRTTRGDSNANDLVVVEGLPAVQTQMLLGNQADTTSPVKIHVANGEKAQQNVRVFNALCAAQILQFVAANGLDYNLTSEAPWSPLPRDDVPFGRCVKTVPIRPTESWILNQERGVFERSTEPGESRSYYLALQDAPQAFEIWLDREHESVTVKYYPKVVAHHAASHLVRSRGPSDDIDKDVVVSYRLSDLRQQADPVVLPFIVRNCRSEAPSHVSLNAPYHLYERQAKVVSKMLAIEDGERPFEEVEVTEMGLPGSTGLSLVARASRGTSLRGGVIADAIGAGKTVISIAILAKGIEKARSSRCLPRNSGATLVVLPPALIDQWDSEIHKFSSGMRVTKIYDFSTLLETSVNDIIESDVVIAPIDILESSGYLENLFRMSKLERFQKHKMPKLPDYSGQKEMNAARGVWIPATSADPYGGGNNPLSQRRRDQSAYYTVAYQEAIDSIRAQAFAGSKTGVPLEFFSWERIIVDEVHECLCTTKSELDSAREIAKEVDGTASGFFREKNRRAGRELLGITQRDVSKRPLVCRRGIFGLTGTPLLDSSSRVTELANLMGGVYVTGLSSHWRKLERESCRDIFLHNYLEPKQSREIRRTIYSKCQDYLDRACCRNKVGEEMVGISLIEERRTVQMTDEEKALYLASQSGIAPDKKSLAIQTEDFDPSAGHDISKFLRQNARLSSRGRVLVEICQEILAEDPTRKILVFTDGKIGAGWAARDALSELGCTWLDPDDSVQTKNRKIGWYQHGDATPEDRARPRVLVLHFEHAAGLNLQSECSHLILFTPLYVGVGGISGDAVADASTEMQAIGRVYRPGQLRPQVHVYRIEVQGPDGEECLDGQLIRRNTDEETQKQAVNGGDEL